jgi:hypothetical protein
LHGHRFAQSCLGSERFFVQRGIGSAKQGGEKLGTANGNRTRISALKGPRANRCTIAAWMQQTTPLKLYGKSSTRESGAKRWR